MIHFNTSNVFVYHRRRRKRKEYICHFNTSNVFVYQPAGRKKATNTTISIHLMFLFIASRLEGTLHQDAFQYI